MLRGVVMMFEAILKRSTRLEGSKGAVLLRLHKSSYLYMVQYKTRSQRLEASDET